MTAGLRKQIERANALVYEKPKMEVVKTSEVKVTKNIGFDWVKLNKKLFK